MSSISITYRGLISLERNLIVQSLNIIDLLYYCELSPFSPTSHFHRIHYKDNYMMNHSFAT